MTYLGHTLLLSNKCFQDDITYIMVADMLENRMATLLYSRIFALDLAKRKYDKMLTLLHNYRVFALRLARSQSTIFTLSCFCSAPAKIRLDTNKPP
jgi:hypothetical protein